MSDTLTTKICTGPCGRELPVNEDNFYRQSAKGGDGFAPRCRDCVKADAVKRRAVLKARREAEPEPLKLCQGPCGRELPRDADHFARDPMDRPRPRCRQCETAAELARELEAELTADTPTKRCTGPCGRELPADPNHFHRSREGRYGVRSRCHDCIAVDAAERRRNPAAPPAPPPRPYRSAPTRPPLGLTDPTSPARRAIVRRHVEHAPDGRKAEAGKEIRARLAGIDRQVERLHRPPFDVNELLLTMADEAEDVAALGAALRRTGWRPEGVTLPDDDDGAA